MPPGPRHRICVPSLVIFVVAYTTGVGPDKPTQRAFLDPDIAVSFNVALQMHDELATLFLTPHTLADGFSGKLGLLLPAVLVRGPDAHCVAQSIICHKAVTPLRRVLDVY